MGSVDSPRMPVSIWLAVVAFMVIGYTGISVILTSAGTAVHAAVLATALAQAGLVTFVVLRRRTWLDHRAQG